MKSIKRRFDNISEKYPFWSSFICFQRAIEGQKFETRTIRHWFKKLVDKDDYDRKDRKAILQSLENLKVP